MLGSTMRRNVGELGLDEDTDPVIHDPPLAIQSACYNLVAQPVGYAR